MAIKFNKESLSLLTANSFEPGYTPVGITQLNDCASLVVEGSEQWTDLLALFAALMELITAVNAVAPVNEDGTTGVNPDNLFSVHADEVGQVKGIYGASISAVEKEGESKKLCLFIGNCITDIVITYVPRGKIFRAEIELHDLVGELIYSEVENAAGTEKYPRLNWRIPLASGESLDIPVSLSSDVKEEKDFNLAVKNKDVLSIVKPRGTGVTGISLAELGLGTFTVIGVLKSGISEKVYDWDTTRGAWWLVQLEDGRAVFINGKDKTAAALNLWNTQGTFPMPCLLKVQKITPNDDKPDFPKVMASLVRDPLATPALKANQAFKMPELKSAAPADKQLPAIPVTTQKVVDSDDTLAYSRQLAEQKKYDDDIPF